MCSAFFQGKMKDGEIMIKAFTSNGYKYVLAGPVLVVPKVKLNGVDISKYLSNNTKISWYDVSKNSGRDVTNADGIYTIGTVGQLLRLEALEFRKLG